MSTTTTDPIADMLTRIRNAIAVDKNEVSLPHSNIKEAVARLLKDNKFLHDVGVEQGVVGKILKLTLHNDLAPAQITEIVRLSRPGRRHYVSASDIPVVKRGRGIVIVSTSRGIMTGNDAKEQHIGGELICRVY